MALQHELRNARVWVPELYAAVLGAGENPVAVGGECDAEHEVLSHKVSCDLEGCVALNHTLCPSKVRMHLPLGAACVGMKRLLVVNSHILIVLSRLPLTRRSPDGANATL